jgi:lysozyme
MATDLITRVMASEGFRDKKYIDSRGFLTIGYGFCIDAGISRYCAGALCEAQLHEARSSIQLLPWYQACDAVRQDVLTELVFNMGLQKLLGFHHMLAALSVKDWDTAADELQHSAWFAEVGTRAPPLVAIIRSGA